MFNNITVLSKYLKYFSKHKNTYNYLLVNTNVIEKRLGLKTLHTFSNIFLIVIYGLSRSN